MKEKIFNIIQIGDKSNRLSRAFDIFITITIVCNILVTFLQTFDQLSSFSGLFFVVEAVTVFIFCIEYALRIWTANYLYPGMSKSRATIRFSFLLTVLWICSRSFLLFSCPGLSFSVCCAWQEFSTCSV